MAALSRLTKILTVALAAVLLAACGGNSGNSGGSVQLAWRPRDAQLVHVVRFGRGKNAWLHVADLVTQKYPNIKIQFETTPFNDYWTKLTTEAASGSSTLRDQVCRVSGRRSSATCSCRSMTT